MNNVEELFLKILSASINGEFNCSIKLSSRKWDDLFTLADEHGILPLVYDTCCKYHLLESIEKTQKKQWRSKALAIATRQIIQSKEFLTIILHAQEQGLNPIVLKGIVCRNLYQYPMLRISVDEDLLINSNEAERYHEFLLSEGLFIDDLRLDREAASELSYHKENSPTYIELHKVLFDPQSEAYGNLNELFPGLFSNTIEIQIEDVSICTLNPNYHLLYLILHAFKHFVHCGIGIRAICDIGLFANCYANEIDWDWIRSNLEQIDIFYYCKALLRILQVYLVPNAKFFDQIINWQLDTVEIQPLLDDILASGIHGASSLARLHSSNITLQAISDNRNRQKVNDYYLRQSLLPSLKKMVGRYSYLKKLPFLLPFAWLQRIIHYILENKKNNTIRQATASLQLGEQRIQLLEQYHIIRENK